MTRSTSVIPDILESSDTPKSECALAYALWDAMNSVKMVKPDDIQEHIRLARRVRYWLNLHGYTLRRKRKLADGAGLEPAT